MWPRSRSGHRPSPPCPVHFGGGCMRPQRRRVREKYSASSGANQRSFLQGESLTPRSLSFIPPPPFLHSHSFPSQLSLPPVLLTLSFGFSRAVSRAGFRCMALPAVSLPQSPVSEFPAHPARPQQLFGKPLLTGTCHRTVDYCAPVLALPAVGRHIGTYPVVKVLHHQSTTGSQCEASVDA